MVCVMTALYDSQGCYSADMFGNANYKSQQASAHDAS